MTDGASTTGERAPSVAREPWQPATITAVSRLTSRVVSVTLRPERWRPFLAGQHADVRLTAEDGYRTHRSYSIASPPAAEGTLELVIELLGDGEVSPFFHEVAAAGDTVEIRGPSASHFAWRPEEPGAVFLAAGGSGVVPFLSIVRQRAHVTAPSPMALLYSARSLEDVIAGEELLAHEQAQRGLVVSFALTRQAPRRSSDFAARIDASIVAEMMARLGEPVRHAFVCGAQRFVGSVADLLVGAGVPAQSIRTERYGGS